MCFYNATNVQLFNFRYPVEEKILLICKQIRIALNVLLSKWLHKMRKYDNLIIIGGTGRNIGKTTLAEKLIARFSGEVPVTALKIANIKPGDETFHGHDIRTFQDKIRIEKETRTDGHKDSMRFLKAGAAASWYIQTEDAYLPETFPEIEKILRKSPWIICESNSLRNFVRPAVFVMIRGKETFSAKKGVDDLLRQADAVEEAFQEKAFEALINRIKISDRKFVLS